MTTLRNAYGSPAHSGLRSSLILRRAELEAEDAFWDRLVGDGLPVERWPT
jgi:hypothetical protein